jgi:hypothetical protein
LRFHDGSKVRGGIRIQSGTYASLEELRIGETLSNQSPEVVDDQRDQFFPLQVHTVRLSD